MSSKCDWRDAIESKRATLQDEQPKMIVNVLKVFLDWLQLHYILDAAETYSLQAVSLSCTQPLHPSVLFRKWLQRFEFMVPDSTASTWALYREYHAAHLQRAFLRRVLLSQYYRRPQRLAVIAGSYPVSMFAMQECGSKWRANDIDIFVDSEVFLRDLVKAYRLDVMTPLRLDISARFSRWYPGRKKSQHASKASCRAMKSSTLIETLYEKLTFWEAEVDPSEEEMQQLWKSMEALPTTLRENTYTIHCTVRLQAKEMPNDDETMYASAIPQNATPRDDETMYASAIPQSILPLNIICVTCKECVNSNNFGDVVCGGFDMKQCAVSMTVTEQLKYEFCQHGDAFAHVLRKHIQLTSASFSGTVLQQVERMSKYIRRGFRFP